MNNYVRTLSYGIVLLGLVGAASAQKKTQSATTKPAQTKPKPVTVTVKEVSGTAQRLTSEKDNKWAPLKVGDKLDEMTVIRTGFRTRVVLAFADNSVVTIDRATKMGIRQFRKEGKVTKTSLGLKYGSLRTTVEKARGPNDFTVSTPVATLAVTGSDGQSSFSGDFGFEMKCLSGDWNVQKGSKSLNLTGNEGTNNNLLSAIKMAKKGFMPMIGDLFGLSGKEKNYMTYYGSGRGGIGFAPQGTFGGIIKQPAPRRLPSPVISTPTTPQPVQEIHVPGMGDEIGM